MDDQQTIYEAAKNGQLQILQMCIEQYPRNTFPTLMSQRTQGMTPLLIACRNGHVDIVEYLLDECGAETEQMGWADEDGLNVDGAEALWWATHHGQLSVVRSLLTRGANVNGSIPRYIPLVEACVQGDLQIVKYLVANGVDVGAFQTDGSTALRRACHRGHHRIVSYLIRHGVDLHREGTAALHTCIRNLNLRCFKLLLRYGAEVDRILSLITPLMFVRRCENPPELEYSLGLLFIQRFPLVVLESLGFTCVDINQREPFTLHTKRRTVEKDEVNGHRVLAVQLNLEGAEERINILRITKPIEGAVDMQFVTASFYPQVSTGYRVDYTHEPATGVSAWEMVTALQRLSTVSVNQLTWNSIILLELMFEAMMKNDRQVVYELVVAVFYVAANAIGMTGVLIYAQPFFDEARYILLVTMTLLFCAARLLPNMLEEHMISFHDILRDLNRVDPRDSLGQTPLHMICSRGPDGFAPLPPESILVVFRLLLKFGADADAVDVDGNSPLHHVAMSTPVKHDVIDLLLSRGAAFDLRNARGQRFMELLPEEERRRYRLSNYLSLQCLAATAILNHAIPRDVLPRALIHFVNLHR